MYSFSSVNTFLGCSNVLTLIIAAIIVFFIAMAYIQFNTDTAPPNDLESCSTNALPFCNLSDDLQFNNFIFLGFDAVSWLFIDKLRELLHEHSHEYIQYTTRVRYTSEILKSWLTGRDNEKANPRPLPGDNLFTSFQRTHGQKRIHIIGTSSSLHTEIATPDREFWNVSRIPDWYPDRKFYPYSFWLMPKNRDALIHQLEEWKKHNVSVWGWEDETDRIQHSEGGHYSVSSSFSTS